MEHASSPRAATEDRPIEPGRTLGRYEVLHRIASGGMATVFLARATGVGGFARLVAMKVCHPHLEQDEEFAEMFLQEARLAARIHHPNVVATLDVGRADGLYLVMDYVEGEPLSRLLQHAVRSRQRMPAAIATRIVLDALAGLHAAHELRGSDGPLGLVHRDVSPQNLMVGTDGRAQIVDFGLAKATSRAAASREGGLKGKLAYMAPEQFDAGVVTRQVDVYAAGVMAWEALTGERLHACDTDAETIHSVMHEDPAAPSQIVRGLPTALDAPILRALQRDPARRFATAAEFAEALEQCGAPIASAREVAAYVTAAIGDSIVERREIIESLTRTGRVSVEAVSKVVSAPSAFEPALSVPSETSDVVESNATRVTPSISDPAPVRSLRWVVAAVVVIALAVGGGVLGGALARTPSPRVDRIGVSAPTSMPSAPSVTPSVAEVDAGAPSVEAPAVAAPAQPSETSDPVSTDHRRTPRTRRSRTASRLYVPGGL